MHNIIIELNGRLGNILFCLACGLSYAERSGGIAWVEDWGYNTHLEYARKYLGVNIPSYLYPTEYFKKIIEKSPITFENIPIVNQDVKITGFRQSPQYFSDGIMKKYFKVEQIVTDRVKELYGEEINEYTAIHVRRGDYLFGQHIFYVRDEAYYRKFMALFPKEEKFIFVSDDIKWCKEKFGYVSNCIFADKDDDEIPNMIIDLGILTITKNVLISNSTFGWWGAYLNQNEDKNIYYTLPWLKNDLSCDIIPRNSNWIEFK